jgi:hypothetical protein
VRWKEGMGRNRGRWERSRCERKNQGALGEEMAWCSLEEEVGVARTIGSGARALGRNG